jgi:hypothetical protein
MPLGLRIRLGARDSNGVEAELLTERDDLGAFARILPP